MKALVKALLISELLELSNARIPIGIRHGGVHRRVAASNVLVNEIDIISASVFSSSTDKKNTHLKGRSIEKTNHNINVNETSNNRVLQNGSDLLAKRSFPECIEQSLNPEECRNYIEQVIDSAGGHEVGDVNVKVHIPRTPDVLADSYWMVEVPVNIRGFMACDRNKGVTSYPFQWMNGASGEELDVEGISCYGLSAGDCCVKIRSYGRTLTESGYDSNGQCLSCFVHQEPLVPYVNKETETTEYLDFVVHMATMNDDGMAEAECKPVQLTAEEVDGHDAVTASRIDTAITSLETFDRARSCIGFDTLLRDLYNGATVIHPLSPKIGQFACNVCYGGLNDLTLEDEEVSSMIEDMLKLLKRNNPPNKSSKENCVFVYTNDQGEVVKVPELGGGVGGAAHHLDAMMPNMPPTIPPGSTCSPFESQSVCADDEGCIQTEDFDQVYKCMKLCTHATYPSDPLYPCNEDEQCRLSRVGHYACQAPRCLTMPSLCDEETEFCYYVQSQNPLLYRNFYSCQPLSCSVSSPRFRRECPSQDDVCQEFGDHEINENFVIENRDYCRPKNCQEDPSICSDDEICFDGSPTYEFEGFSSRKDVSCIKNLCLKPDSPDAPSCEDDEVCDYTRAGIPKFFCRNRNCFEDPSICQDGETCELADTVEEYHCRPSKTCETDPSICPEGWYCGPSRYFWSDKECRMKTCQNNPTVCKSHERCEFSISPEGHEKLYPPYSEREFMFAKYQCRPDDCRFDTGCGDQQECIEFFSLEYVDFINQCVDRPSCIIDPSICNEDEFCHDIFEPGVCRKNTCIQDQTICNEDQFCEYGFDRALGICRQNTCHEDPSICEEGTVCLRLSTYLGICLPNTCREDPTLCNENEYCDTGTPTFDYYDSYFEYNQATCTVKT